MDWVVNFWDPDYGRIQQDQEWSEVFFYFSHIAASPTANQTDSQTDDPVACRGLLMPGATA